MKKLAEYLKKLMRDPEVYSFQNINFHDTDLGIKGRGFLFGNKKFIHHGTLHHLESAFFTFTKRNKLFFAITILIILSVLFLDWHKGGILLLGSLTVLYFIDLLFNAFLIYSSLSKRPEIKIAPSDFLGKKDSDWPTYTVFCPLYKEWQVVPQFVKAMAALSYPQEKLQIILLLEEDDQETISKIQEQKLPRNFEVVVVPNSRPKTKPKAMNYGLRFARGEYLVVYDAEDIPEPMQLKEAILAFTYAKPKTICIQAKLNFYNTTQNILTRLFTAEYSLWFDLVLPGLQFLDAPIPLGGTSNHFKTEYLKQLDGWDAFNVTEDCDLGMRLAKRGFKTAVMESTTYEEANSSLKNWYTQRSRWMKGYIQTYFVHMRRPESFVKKGAVLQLIMSQLTVGGKIFSIFINPLLWMLTLLYFVLRAHVGTFIESFFPAWILYIGVCSFIMGNFLCVYYYMVGCVKRKQDGLIKYMFLVPFYWLAISAAAWRGVYEVLVKPHYWAKTVHGLHLTQPKSIPGLMLKNVKAFFILAAVIFTGLCAVILFHSPK